MEIANITAQYNNIYTIIILQLVENQRLAVPLILFADYRCLSFCLRAAREAGALLAVSLAILHRYSMIMWFYSKWKTSNCFSPQCMAGQNLNHNKT